MSFSQKMRDMDFALFNEFSEVGLYNGTDKVSVVIDKDVEQFGAFETNGPTRRHEVSFLTCEIRDPKRGHTIQTSQGTFTLDGSISNDGYVARWHINAS